MVTHVSMTVPPSVSPNPPSSTSARPTLETSTSHQPSTNEHLTVRPLNQIPPDTAISPLSSTITLVTDISQPPVTTCHRPVPDGSPSATYTALPAEDSHTTAKPPNKSSPASRQDCWEAFQDTAWGLELLSLLFALASTIAVCVILGHANNRLLSSWTLPIQPNSLVSVFSTLAKTALMFPIASVISQMKWIWFQEPRSLVHLQSFDKASRGPWGAMRLIWDLFSKASGWTAKAACVLTIAALAFEPTAQQVISFETRETQIHNATAQLLVTSSWNSSSFSLSAVSLSKQIGLQTSLLNALSPQRRDSLPEFACTARTCSWDQVETLAACSGCASGQLPTFSLVDISNRSDANTSRAVFEAAAPPSVTVGAVMDDFPFPNVTMQPMYSLYDAKADTMMNVASGSFLRFAAVDHSTNEPERNSSSHGVWKWRQNDTVDYYLCRVHPCVRTFKNIVVRNGAYSFGSQTSKWLIAAGDPSWNGYRTDEAASVSDWTIDFDTSQKVNQVLGTMLSHGVPRFSGQLHSYYQNGSIDGAVGSLLYESNLTTVMGALSDVISAAMRSKDNLAVKNQSGVAWEPQTFVVVNWAWMACPLVILATTTVTLAVAMIQTSKQPILYKDSAVALLSLGIGHMDAHTPDKVVRGDTVGQRYTACQMETDASGLTTRLFKDGKGNYMFLKC
ncbi:hypothetical protein KVR01_009458 [Diaporthe batatas]|uniref:uncharacterized protein n=1 Tax=Diaporthe batatas TaxID=748121 RepID=UPI001D05778D|nr:uncharacterized protein KVR01_009458 [Diaporthe batatas]KAG8161194.1 hypothetical protein KVR01_009458 [Diaporthe batatas]